MMSDASSILAGDLTLRPIARDEMSVVLGILQDPTVARWWGTYDIDRVTAEYGEPDDDTVAYLIEYEGEAAGLIQYWEETDPDYRHASIDISLSAAFQGRTIGQLAIRALARFLFEEKGHHRLTIDPAANNRNAITAYERVGFRRVGIMRGYERGPDGTWHDGLLMDMLAGELND